MCEPRSPEECCCNRVSGCTDMRRMCCDFCRQLSCLLHAGGTAFLLAHLQRHPSYQRCSTLHMCTYTCNCPADPCLHLLQRDADLAHMQRTHAPVVPLLKHLLLHDQSWCGDCCFCCCWCCRFRPWLPCRMSLVPSLSLCLSPGLMARCTLR